MGWRSKGFSVLERAIRQDDAFSVDVRYSAPKTSFPSGARFW
jgi:hypothetical protein